MAQIETAVGAVAVNDHAIAAARALYRGTDVQKHLSAQNVGAIRYPDHIPRCCSVRGVRKIRRRLEVLSTPPEATILLDDREVGRTPKILIGIETGVHILVLRKRGKPPRRARSPWAHQQTRDAGR